ncbi:MAG: hypothetical protein QF682_08330 [Candidatus Thermoplasmatota archaeon]|jgi:preprotein translocase subunit Sss1|nr:hypothetical protein [Candidatus Thermoplasmatota archaeon]
MAFDSNEDLLDENYREEVSPIPAFDDVKEKTISEGTTKITREQYPIRENVSMGVTKTRKKRRKRKKRKMSAVLRIIVIGLIILIVGIVGYLGYLYYNVSNVSRPDVPQNELSYKYQGGEKYPNGEYSPKTVYFEREPAYEKEGTEYVELIGLPVIPIYQIETVYTNGIKQLSSEPPFYGEFHIGSYKKIDAMDKGTILYYADERMDEVLNYRNIHTIGLIESRDYEYKIEGERAFYYEYIAEIPKGADEPGYVVGRDVRIVLVVWLDDEDMSGKYFLGISVIRIRNQGSFLVAEEIEDLTTWEKIISLIPRVEYVE